MTVATLANEAAVETVIRRLSDIDRINPLKLSSELIDEATATFQLAIVLVRASGRGIVLDFAHDMAHRLADRIAWVYEGYEEWLVDTFRFAIVATEAQDLLDEDAFATLVAPARAVWS